MWSLLDIRKKKKGDVGLWWGPEDKRRRNKNEIWNRGENECYKTKEKTGDNLDNCSSRCNFPIEFFCFWFPIEFWHHIWYGFWILSSPLLLSCVFNFLGVAASQGICVQRSHIFKRANHIKRHIELELPQKKAKPVACAAATLAPLKHSHVVFNSRIAPLFGSR